MSADDRRFYGRRKGKALRPGRQALVTALLPRLRVPAPGLEAGLDPASLFTPRPNAVWLEIGFGGGEHLAAQAAAHPGIGLIGCEPFINGVGSLLAQVDERRLGNVRVFDDDARLLLPGLAGGSVDRVFLLFADPWPKARHHRRRFVQDGMLDELARLMRPGAEFRFASDHMGYVRWTLERTAVHPAFRWTARHPRDWRTRPADAVETRYEAKARRDGRPCVYLSFERLG